MGAGPKVTNCTNATESHAVNTANYRPIRPLQAEKQRSPEQVQPAIAPRQANARARALRVKMAAQAGRKGRYGGRQTGLCQA
jgi:hypothetical protein